MHSALLGKRKLSSPVTFTCKKTKYCDLQQDILLVSTKTKKHSCSLQQVEEYTFKRAKLLDENIKNENLDRMNLKFFSLFLPAKLSKCDGKKIPSEKIDCHTFLDNNYWSNALMDFDEAYSQNQTKVKQNSKYAVFNDFQYWKPVECSVEEMDFDIHSAVLAG